MNHNNKRVFLILRAPRAPHCHSFSNRKSHVTHKGPQKVSRATRHRADWLFILGEQRVFICYHRTPERLSLFSYSLCLWRVQPVSPNLLIDLLLLNGMIMSACSTWAVSGTLQNTCCNRFFVMCSNIKLKFASRYMAWMILIINIPNTQTLIQMCDINYPNGSDI